MIERTAQPDGQDLAALSGRDDKKGVWTERLVHFLRAMAAISMLAGLRYWGSICGFAFVPEGGFEAQPVAWQTATVFFAVIDLVAAVGLWLAAPWGAVVWLTSTVSMIVVEVFFPQVYDDMLVVILFHFPAIIAYLVLAVLAAREQQPQ